VFADMRCAEQEIAHALLLLLLLISANKLHQACQNFVCASE
jgi:hypothetical protein